MFEFGSACRVSEKRIYNSSRFRKWGLFNGNIIRNKTSSAKSGIYIWDAVTHILGFTTWFPSYEHTFIWSFSRQPCLITRGQILVMVDMRSQVYIHNYIPHLLFWLVVSTYLKNISQLGLLFPIWKVIKFMFQTTNQPFIIGVYYPASHVWFSDFSDFPCGPNFHWLDKVSAHFFTACRRRLPATVFPFYPFASRRLAELTIKNGDWHGFYHDKCWNIMEKWHEGIYLGKEKPEVLGNS